MMQDQDPWIQRLVLLMEGLNYPLHFIYFTSLVYMHKVCCADTKAGSLKQEECIMTYTYYLLPMILDIMTTHSSSTACHPHPTSPPRLPFQTPTHAHQPAPRG